MFQHSSPRPFAAALPALALMAFLCLAGCRGGGPPVGTVSGKVTFEGKAVGEGRVTYQSPKTGVGGEALLNKDGAYALKTPLPVGEYTVTVAPLIVRQQVGGKGPVVGEEKPAPDIPLKYRTVGDTNLKANVKEGKNDLDFDMKR